MQPVMYSGNGQREIGGAGVVKKPGDVIYLPDGYATALCKDPRFWKVTPEEKALLDEGKLKAEVVAKDKPENAHPVYVGLVKPKGEEVRVLHHSDDKQRAPTRPAPSAPSGPPQAKKKTRAEHRPAREPTNGGGIQ